MNALTITSQVHPSGSPHPAFLLDVASIRAQEKRWLAQTAPGALMAAAGKAVAEVTLRVWRRLPASTPVILLVGPGNNGGDALVAGRHLMAAGLQVTASVFPGLESTPPAADDARRVWHDWHDSGLGFVPLDEVFTGNTPPLVIDGLFGIGLTRPLPDWLGALAERLEAAGSTVISIDVPSGLDADTGSAVGRGAVIRADHTVTMIADKPGLHTGRGLRVAGQVWVAPLVSEASPSGAPSWGAGEAPVPPAGAMPLLNAGWARTLLPHRAIDAHKGTAGDVLILGGRLGMAGAARLAARGAMAGGAGRVWVTTESGPAAYRGADTKHGQAPHDAQSPNPHTLPVEPRHLLDNPADMPDGDGMHTAWTRPGQPVDPQHPEVMQFRWQAGKAWPGQAPVLVVGCGMGTDDTARHWLQSALQSGQPMVIDADALNLLAISSGIDRAVTTTKTPAAAPIAPVPEHDTALPLHENGTEQKDTNPTESANPGTDAAAETWETGTQTVSPRILTPHPQEAARLLGTDVAVVQADRLRAARTLAERFDAVVVLKGAGTVIAQPTRHLHATDGTSHGQHRTTPLKHASCTPHMPFCTAVNGSGHPVLGTAGTGDVLAGTIGALLATMCRSTRRASPTAPPAAPPTADSSNPQLRPVQEPDANASNQRAAALALAWRAACLGVWLHGHAGEWLAQHRGPMGVSASELAGCYPAIFRQLARNRGPG